MPSETTVARSPDGPPASSPQEKQVCDLKEKVRALPDRPGYTS